MSFDDAYKLEPLALAPREAARFLSISKRSISRLIADGKIIARKVGARTLVDVASLKAYYDCLPVKHQARARS
jgi:excisionase family DNA binding protein